MNSLLYFVVSLMLMLPGKPANKAKLMLESVNKSQYVAYQQTGIKGKVSFEYLNPGNYQLLIDFPQQEGKYLKERTRHLSMAKAAYDPKSRTYYYQGEEGFFSVKVSGLKKKEYSSMKPIFREVRDGEEIQAIIMQFQVLRKKSKVSFSVKALKASQYKRAVEKIEGDVSLYSIPGIR